jgi:hypothetical protein
VKKRRKEILVEMVWTYIVNARNRWPKRIYNLMPP